MNYSYRQLTPDTFLVEHSGETAVIQWRPAHGRWRDAWWLSVGGSDSFPFGGVLPDDATIQERIDYVCETYIGEPPPADHSRIWGGYTCAKCGAKGVKLWRDYQTCLDSQTLTCRSCSLAKSGKNADDLRGDQIGWLVPAVPTADGSTFWGYSSVPSAAVKWWRALPEVSP